MKAKDLIALLNEKIPKADTWRYPEPHGIPNRHKSDSTALDLEKDIKRILYCVTPTSEVIKQFKDNNYDLLISHHPFTVGVPQLIYHTALDCCEGGLNDMWRDALGVKDAKHFDEKLGWYGEIESIKFEDLCVKIEQFMGYPIIGQKYNELEEIKSVVICTGLGGMVTDMAQRSQADCYIIGEAVEPANEMGFKAVIETGHTHSEWIGVRLFKKLLEPHGVEVDSAMVGFDRFGHEFFKSHGKPKGDQ